MHGCNEVCGEVSCEDGNVSQVGGQNYDYQSNHDQSNHRQNHGSTRHQKGFENQYIEAFCRKECPNEERFCKNHRIGGISRQTEASTESAQGHEVCISWLGSRPHGQGCRAARKRQRHQLTCTELMRGLQ